MAMLLAADVRAQNELSVSALRESVEELGGRQRFVLRGIVANEGAQALQFDGVRLAMLDRLGAETAIGYGLPLRTVLGVGEDVPFEVQALLLPDQDRSLFQLEPLVGGPAPEPLRPLRVSGIVSRTLDGSPTLLGDLTNEGARYLLAAEDRVHVAFLDEEGRVLALRAATLPVLQGAGISGQGHGPGETYPWLLVLPDVERSRRRMWTTSVEYPDDVFPVPLGLTNTQFAEDGEALHVEADLVHCGFARVSDARLVVVQRDDDGALRSFAAARLRLPRTLEMGATLPVRIEIAGRGLADVPGLELRAYALAYQAVPPTAWPCSQPTPDVRRIWLPTLAHTSEIR